LVITESGHYLVCNDLFFNGEDCPSENSTRAISQTQPTRFGITIAANDVFIDFNDHTYTIENENIGGLITLSDFVRSTVSSGTIIGDNQPGQFGVFITNQSTSVSNMAFANIAAAPATAAAAAANAAAAAPAAAAAVAAAAAAAAAAHASTRSVTIDPTSNTLSGILLEKLKCENCLNGISLQGFITNLIVRDVSINRSIEMGITQPSRAGFHGNFIFENVLIANSGLNGIYTTFNQDNWFFNRCQIRNSVLNGAIFEGTQNLTFNDCQITDSGAKGLIASIRQSQNVTLSGLEIFNSGDEVIRVDNVQNLSIEDSKFINYVATEHPICKIQDVNNGYIKGSEFMSTSGLSDGIFIRNSHGLLLEKNLVKITSNTTCEPKPKQPPLSNNNIAFSLQLKHCPPTIITTGPTAINLQGGVTAMRLAGCVVSGSPSVGIALRQDNLSGIEEGIIIEDCLVDGAQNIGILFESTRNCAVFESQVVNSQGDGIFINSTSAQTAVRDNTLTGNRLIGIDDRGINSQIYRNFASGNGRNYSLNILSAVPAAGIGSIENING
jgi:hypothetical protein